MNSDDRIFVAGHRGLVGSAVCRRLHELGYRDIITRSRQELDLREQNDVRAFFEETNPQHVIMAAATVGGIGANREHPAQFIRDNLMIQTNVIDAAFHAGVETFCFLGSNCVYPRHTRQPIREEYLLSSYLEPTNEAYAVAKIAGITMCQSYAKEFGWNAICVMPANLYGTGDNFDPETSHVIPALIRKFVEAKERGNQAVTVWGTGKARREFLHVDDLADAITLLMNKYRSPEIINIGSGQDMTIAELANAVRKATGYEGRIEFDDSRPDGSPRKLLDSRRILDLGWKPGTSFKEGLKQAVNDYRRCQRETLS